ncbi:MAG: hypothetical protein SGJ24_17940 [Chloroflexota bacterium]|nr:hypothetical protein [Chloroflexota bacterium]
MTMLPSETPREQQRQQVMIVGAISGLLFGLFGAYMFNRAGGDRQMMSETHKATTGELITLIVSAFAFIRQIVELGRPETPATPRRK